VPKLKKRTALLQKLKEIFQRYVSQPIGRVIDQHFGKVGFQKIVYPSSARSFLETHVQATAQTVNKLKDSFGFCFECGFHHQISVRIPNRRRNRCRMHIHPNILGVVNEGAPCCRR
jgi:ribosomal protein S26